MQNYTKDFPKEIKPDMCRYYDLRKKVRELYANGVQVNPKVSDLCSLVLQVRDKNRCVESINIDTTNFSIEVELEENTDYDKCIKVKNEISTIIDNYINDNANTLGINTNERDNTPKLYDDISVGTYIKFNL